MVATPTITSCPKLKSFPSEGVPSSGRFSGPVNSDEPTLPRFDSTWPLIEG